MTNEVARSLIKMQHFVVTYYLNVGLVTTNVIFGTDLQERLRETYRETSKKL